MGPPVHLQQTASTGEGSILVPVLFIVAAVLWALLQFRTDRREVWRYRRSLVHPIAVTVRGDAAATWRYLRSFRLRQVTSMTWWRERLQFKRVWQDFENF